MRHLIFGTAGHIDHGKTTLIRTLTGVDCDTHHEEKRRGITINLGFTYCDFPSGRISFIDVPGHKDFISTMVAGTGGVDRALLVIAADEGVMPQTREHLCILDLLGVHGGIVAVTRTDLADDDIRAAAREEARELIQASCMAGSSIIPVSARTGAGLEQLRQALDNALRTATPRPGGPVFRMYIDRCFSVAGHGVIVAGTVLGGCVERGGSVYLLPGERQYRIRGIEAHNVPVDHTTCGMRTSMSLVGLQRADVCQGMLLSDRPLHSSQLLDARIEYTAEQGSVGIRSRAVMLIGTQRTEVSMHLLDTDQLATGGDALAQLHSTVPCMAFPGDRFILRNSSDDKTLGGGVIIDAHPLHHRRRRWTLLRDLARIVNGDLAERVAHEARKSLSPISCGEIASALGQSLESIERIPMGSLPDDVTTVATDHGIYVMRAELPPRIEQAVLKCLAIYHKRNPLEDGGLTCEELMSVFGSGRNEAHAQVLRTLLRKAEECGELKRVRNTWVLQHHTVRLTEKDHSDLSFVEQFHRRDDMKAPLMSELRAHAHMEGISERRLRHLLFFLSARGILLRIGDEYLHHSVVEPCRQVILEFLERHEEGLTVAGFRDLVRGNRRVCLLLLTHFDGQGIIERRGDLRFLTDAGRETLRTLRKEHPARTATGQTRESMAGQRTTRAVIEK